jgi:hypothetical protein
MGFKTDRMSAQDKVLNQFKHTLGPSGSVSNKPLTLAEQIAQVDAAPAVKRASDDSEIEKRYNTPLYNEVRAGKK